MHSFRHTYGLEKRRWDLCSLSGFFTQENFFYLKADNLILGFAINSQIFGRVTLFEDNHAFRWSDVRRVVENIFYGMYQFSLFQI